MRPFFSYFGGKHKLAPLLGRPQRDLVIEPFAGAAGYSTYWEPKKVILIERDPVVYSVWQFLSRASQREIMALPSTVDSIAELPGTVCQEAQWLIGFWLNKGTAVPSQRRSNWARSAEWAEYFWGDDIKIRLAHQVDKIRHWRVVHGSWCDAPNVEAHWHIDPPYSRAGYTYRYNQVDYQALAEWCRTRKGFVQVCEHVGADWLPFRPFAVATGGVMRRPGPWASPEAIWESGCGADLKEQAERQQRPARPPMLHRDQAGG